MTRKVRRHKPRFHAFPGKMRRVATKRKHWTNRKIILRFATDRDEYELHATKGYRWRRLPPPGAQAGVINPE